MNSGKWVEDINKLEYEMDEVAKKAKKEAKMEDAKDVISMLKRAGRSSSEVLQELSSSPNYSNVLTTEEIEELVKENY